MTAGLSDREREKARLSRFRDIADRLAGDVWTMEADAGGTRVFTARTSGETVCLCTIHADALPDEYEVLCSGADMLAFFLVLQDRAAAKVRALLADLEKLSRKPKSPAQRAAILCQDAHFQRFLESRGAGGPVRDKQAADTRLKSLIGMASKTELDEVGDAQTRFFRLLDDFRKWKFGRGE